MAPPGGSIENVGVPEHPRAGVGDGTAHQRFEQLASQHLSGSEGQRTNLASRSHSGLEAAQKVVEKQFPNTIIVGADKQGIKQSVHDTTPGHADIRDHGVQSNAALAPEANNRSLVAAHSESMAIKRKSTAADDKALAVNRGKSSARMGQGIATELGRSASQSSSEIKTRTEAAKPVGDHVAQHPSEQAKGVVKETAHKPESPKAAVKETAPKPESPKTTDREAPRQAEQAKGVVKETAHKPESPKAAVKETAPKPESPKAAVKETAHKSESPKAAVKETAPKPESPKAAVKETAHKSESPKAADKEAPRQAEPAKAAVKETVHKSESPKAADKEAPRQAEPVKGIVKEAARQPESPKVVVNETSHQAEPAKAVINEIPRPAELSKVNDKDALNAQEKPNAEGKVGAKSEAKPGAKSEAQHEQNLSKVEAVHDQPKGEEKNVSKSNPGLPAHEGAQVIADKPQDKLANPVASVVEMRNSAQAANDGQLTKSQQEPSLEKLAGASRDLSNGLDHRSSAKSDNLGTDDREKVDLFEQLNNQHILNNQGAAIAQPAEQTQQMVANSAPVYQVDLGRSTTHNSEVTINHAIHSVITYSTERSHETFRLGQPIEELNNHNNNSTQVATNVTATHTTTGPYGQAHTGTANHAGTASGAKHGQGHNPSGTVHGQIPGGQGHGTGHGPILPGTGHDPSTSAHNNGQGHDPASNNSSGNGADPSGTANGNTQPGQGHGQAGQVQGASSNDPSGAGNVQPNQGTINDPSNTQNGQHPVQGHPADPQGKNVVTGPANLDPNNCNGHPGIIILPGYEERPIRNLVTLISEMGMALGPLHNVWSPWEEPATVHISTNHFAVQTSGHNDNSANQNIISEQTTSFVQGTLVANNAGIIEQPQTIINTQVLGELIPNNGGDIVPLVTNYDQLPVIETIVASKTVPIEDESNAQPISSGTDGGAVDNGYNNPANIGANSPGDVGAAENSSNIAPNSSVIQDGNIPFNQFLSGAIDYWATDPNSGVLSNSPQVIQSPPISDPVPSDNTVSNEFNGEAWPNHDQLVSAAEHGHGHNENLDYREPEKDISRADFDPWSYDDTQKHNLQEQKNAEQVAELQQRIELIANGMWQEPNENTKRESDQPGRSNEANNTGRKIAEKNDGLIGQLMTLINDINKNKKQINKTYVVKRGDTLESIAQDVLLDSRLGILLYLVNTAQLPKSVGIEWQHTKLPEGMILHLPGDAEINSFRLAMPRCVGQNTMASNLPSQASGVQWQFDQQYLQGVEQRRQNVERLLGSLNSAGNSKTDPETGRHRIVVRFGDTLRSVALKHSTLNDVSLWKLLAQCNNLSTEVDTKGSPVAVLIRGMVLQIPSEQEIATYRVSQAAQIRADSPRKALAQEVLKVS